MNRPTEQELDQLFDFLVENKQYYMIYVLRKNYR